MEHDGKIGFSFSFKKMLLIDLLIFLSVLSLHRFVRAFSSRSERGPPFIVVPGFASWWLLLWEEPGL